MTTSKQSQSSTAISCYRLFLVQTENVPTESDRSTSGAEIALRITDRSARGIATAIGRLIRSGDLVPGNRLPTVRDLARALGTSPTTVSEAWQSLAGAGVIDPRGRNGTFVRDTSRPRGSLRYRSVTTRPSLFALDLSTGVPDPDLLPDQRRALERVSRRNITSSYLDQPVIPQLDETLRESWPFQPEALTVVDGAMDAIDRILRTLVKVGDCVIVEDPGFPPVLDLLEQLEVTPIGVTMDAYGIEPISLRSACERKPAALLVQPRAQNPTGVSMTPERARELAAVVQSAAPPGLVVIEDDHSGDIAWASDASLGSTIADRCVRIKSFSKSHGPDLRLAAVGGAGGVVEALVERRLLGPGWSSRLLQAVLLEMLRDEQTIDRITFARQEYRHRRETMADHLNLQGVTTTGTDGINLWIAVDNEKDALLTLAMQGIGAAPGSPFYVGRGPDHIRVTVGLVSDDTDAVAAAIAASVAPYRRSFLR